ncbi:MAG: MFS transporter [Desulfobulbaceae bacterium]|jgi:EmrB/QacA subfamily drug resistance transporter|nr:MFS transporter [Desulfobulbaceae bacterium]MDY0350597.1 MFS transporter [Desulfobulbaceae bacterium]
MSRDDALQKSALFVTTVTAFMAPFMVSSVNVALPAIQDDLGADAVLLGWIATSYLLATAIILVPAGKFADIYGRKKVFISGVIIYTAGSAASVLVPDVAWFLAMRGVQGIGAAMFITTGMAILTSVFPREKRGRGIGILVTSVYVGLATGPFVGGFLTGLLGWRSIFVLMVLLGLISLAIAVRFLKGEWAEARGEKFDIQGAVIYAVAIFLLVYGATRILDREAAILFFAGCLGLVLFYRRQKKTPYPVFEVGLFQGNRTFLFSSLAALIHYAATFAVTFQISLYLQYLKGMEPQSAGTILMIQPVMMALFSAQAGKLSDTVQPRVLASAGMSLTALGLAFFVFLGESTELWLIASNLALLGFGFALFSSPNMSAIMGSVERRQYGIASGTVATMRLLGQMFSMAIATVFLAIFIGRQEIRVENYPLFQTSMQACFMFFVLLCVVGIGFSLFRGDVGK